MGSIKRDLAEIKVLLAAFEKQLQNPKIKPLNRFIARFEALKESAKKVLKSATERLLGDGVKSIISIYLPGPMEIIVYRLEALIDAIKQMIKWL